MRNNTKCFSEQMNTREDLKLDRAKEMADIFVASIKELSLPNKDLHLLQNYCNDRLGLSNFWG